ncbi:MAG: DUF58 domain-containing protein [Bacillota bacterium]|nr:MAG: hypothetical protein DIU55_07825 [Bacillota bacterium]
MRPGGREGPARRPRRGREWQLPALILVAYAAARLAGGRLPYFVLYLSLLLWAGSWAYTRYVARRITGLVSVDRRRIEVGESIRVKLRLENESFLPIPWAEVEDCTPAHLLASDQPRLATALPLVGSCIVHLTLTARRRGKCPVGPYRVRTGDWLGLFVREVMVESHAQVTIYPRVHPIDDLPVPLAQPFGPVRTQERAFEDPSNPGEIRRYVPGDNPRHIHWRTSARVGTLMIRQYELSATTQLILFPDFGREVHVDGSAAGGGSTADVTAEIAASLASLGVRRRMETGLFCVGQTRFAVGPGKGERVFQEIMEALAQVEPAGDLLLEQVLAAEAGHLGERASLVAITPRLTAHLSDRLLALRARHRVTLILLDAPTFAPEGPQRQQIRAADPALVDLLVRRGVWVYRIPAGADLRRLSAWRVEVGEEVRPWRPLARPPVTS